MSLASIALQSFDEAFSLVLSSVPLPGDWAQRGRCRTAPSGIFFPLRGDSVKPAIAICSRCPVLAECREYALDAPQELTGIWGGTTGKQRRDLRRERLELAEVREQWEERASQSPAGTLYGVLEQLAQHPGRWARIVRYRSKKSAATTASLLRNGAKPTPAGEWQFEGRHNDLGGSDVYALFVGPAEASA